MANSLLGTYLHFLQSPVLTVPAEAISTRKALGSVLRLYSLHLVAIAIAAVPILHLLAVASQNGLGRLFESMPPVSLFLLGAVLIPLLEECLFRLPLRPRLANWAIAASIAIWYSVLWFARLSQPWLVAVAAGLASFNLYLQLRRSKRVIFQSFYEKHPRIVFYLAVALFGAAHITNYDREVWLWLPLLVLPQTIIALLLGFVRLRYGFKWALFTHAFHNGCFLLPLVVIEVFGSLQLQTEVLSGQNLESASFSDSLTLVGIGLYVIGGAALCLVNAWKVIRE